MDFNWDEFAKTAGVEGADTNVTKTVSVATTGTELTLPSHQGKYPA